MHTREIRESHELLQVMTGKKNLGECKTLGKEKRKRNQSEAKEQELLFTWAKMQEKVHPELELLHAIPNGGSRHRLEAYNLKRQGLKSGVPDISLPVPRNEHAGLYIEMKFGKNKASENQKRWIDLLRLHHHKVVICYNFEQAKETILNYLSMSYQTDNEI